MVTIGGPARVRTGRRSRLAPLLGTGILAVGLLATAGPPALAAAAPATAPGVTTRAGHDVLVNLFEWNWRSVARECTQVLGPKGFAGVQVSPPQDPVRRTRAVDPAVLHPWWEVYQPVRYALTSRMGTEKQFRDMVATCRRAGVKVYVDAVINHMTGQGSVSYGGVRYSKYSYAGLYGPADFHHAPADCPTKSGTIEDFNDYRQVTKCELVGLSDLRTETPKVRTRLAAYLNKLLSYGVAGFRVDAAKHVPLADLKAIEKLLRRTVYGDRPYIALEVPFGGPGKLAPKAFRSAGDLLGFDAAGQLKDAFKSYTATPGGSIATLEVFGEDSGLLPSDVSLAFVQNHDTERNGSTLNYKDGPANVLATQFLLASGYGTPQVYSGFAFATGDDSPPADARGFVTDTDCSKGWVCTHRDTGVANMVAWHDVAGRTARHDWYDDGQDLIAFGRGHRAWIAINHEDVARTRTFGTGLPKGTYCDVIHGDDGSAACSGPVVRVDARGRARVTVPAQDCVAIHVGARISS